LIDRGLNKARADPVSIPLTLAIVQDEVAIPSDIGVELLRRSVNVAVRAEIFNLTNTRFFGLPGAVNTSVGAGFGKIGFAGDPRVVQLALKLNF
jgi:hypothetical protein